MSISGFYYVCQARKGDDFKMILPVSTRKITPGMVLGHDVILDSGRILIKKGTILRDDHISCLIKLIAKEIYIISGTDKLPPINESCQDRLCSKQKILGEIMHVLETKCLFDQMPVTQIVGINEGNSLLLGDMADVALIIDTVRIKSESTYHHCVNVGIIAAIIGSWLDYSNEEIRNLMLTGLLHDVGKAIIPLSILNKPSKLNNEEMCAMRRHSALSYRYLADFDSIAETIKVGVLQHHERLDGSGYPIGLEAEDIHDFAKIIALADTYDAITSDRIYRSRKAPIAALKIIQYEICDSKLDHCIGRVFLEKVSAFWGSK